MEPSTLGGFMVSRKPSLDEIRLLSFLIHEADDLVVSRDLYTQIKVADMEDGGMGSLRLFPFGVELPETKFGKQISACLFTDKDGVEVIASLNLDNNGNLYELDIWKTNYANLIHIPEASNFTMCQWGVHT